MKQKRIICEPEFCDLIGLISITLDKDLRDDAASGRIKPVILGKLQNLRVYNSREGMALPWQSSRMQKLPKSLVSLMFI